MRFLFTTRERYETAFYGRVSAELARFGHDSAHIAYSRRAASVLERKGGRVQCLPDLMAALPPFDLEAEIRRIEERYMTPEAPTIRDVYRTDWPNRGRSETEALDRTVRHFLALERVFDEVQPDVVVPEVGSETMRTATHLIGLERGAPVLFLFYTMFDRPLRLYVDTMHAPIVAPEEVRELSAAEREDIDRWIEAFRSRGKPIRNYVVPKISSSVAADYVGHLAVKALWDRRNDYLRPALMIRNRLREKSREILTRRYYTQLDSARPFVYFPIHVTDDYKIKRVIPHCVDQASIIEQVAEALPHGYDVVLKEHPMSLGRNGLAMIRRLTRLPNVRLVDPYTSSHDLIQASEAVVVISSTVGLEALLYDHPVLTMGQPFYGGYGVTVDVDSFREIREKLLEVLRFQPDHERIVRFLAAARRACYEGVPVLVDRSDENAARLARSLHTATTRNPSPSPDPVPA